MKTPVMHAPTRKEIKDCTKYELRTFVTVSENMTTLAGQDPEKLSVREMVEALTELGYKHAYVSPQPSEQESFDARLHMLAEAHNNIGLAPENERWYLIRVENASNPNGKSKNVPISVSFNEDLGYIPRGIPVWVRGRFVHCLEAAVEHHTIQHDITKKFSEGSHREEHMRYPYKLQAVSDVLVKDGLPAVRPGQQIIYSDKHAKVARQRLDLADGRQAA